MTLNDCRCGFVVKAPITTTFFDFAAGDESLGRVVINLFTTEAPKTCAKFIELCANAKGVSYRGSKVDLIDSHCCRMGDHDHLTYPTTSRVFPPEYKTPLENTSARHDRPRLVTMCDTWTPIASGKTWSWFFVTFRPKPNWDGDYVVIGEVTDATWNVIEKIKKKNHHEVHITDCGVIN